MLRENCTISLAEAVERAARGERTIVRQKGKPPFAVVPVADAEYMQRIEDELNLRLLRDAHANKGEKVSWRQLRAELDAKYAVRN